MFASQISGLMNALLFASRRELAFATIIAVIVIVAIGAILASAVGEPKPSPCPELFRGRMTHERLTGMPLMVLDVSSKCLRLDVRDTNGVHSVRYIEEVFY